MFFYEKFEGDNESGPKSRATYRDVLNEISSIVKKLVEDDGFQVNDLWEVEIKWGDVAQKLPDAELISVKTMKDLVREIDGDLYRAITTKSFIEEFHGKMGPGDTSNIDDMILNKFLNKLKKDTAVELYRSPGVICENLHEALISIVKELMEENNYDAKDFMTYEADWQMVAWRLPNSELISTRKMIDLISEIDDKILLRAYDFITFEHSHLGDVCPCELEHLVVNDALASLMENIAVDLEQNATQSIQAFLQPK